MDIDVLAERLVEDSSLLTSVSLTDEIAAPLVLRLKQEVDRYWWINANRSLELADLIIQIGRMRAKPGEIALGLMARGDSLGILGHFGPAWEVLEEAGKLFLASGDRIGWARTRIGRLPMSVDLNCVALALSEAEQARAIFSASGDNERLLRLYMNMAVVYDLLGDYHQALKLYSAALEISERLGELGFGYLGALYTNMGYAYNLLGDFRQALSYYERASAIFSDRQDTSAVVTTQLNIAFIAQSQGHYRQALRLLHQVETLTARDLPSESAHARRVMVECYLALNRFAEARDLAKRVADDFRRLDAAYESAHASLHWAMAEAQLLNFQAAHLALQAAEELYRALDAVPWMAMVALLRGRIALKQGNTATARREAKAALTSFTAENHRANYADGLLLEGQALLVDGELDTAARVGNTALHMAQACGLNPLRYSAHLLLGNIAERQSQFKLAKRHYHAAAATVDRVQHGLTITLRPGFLEDKGEALRTLLRLYMDAGEIQCAFETLERAKSQLWMGYLSNRENFRWSSDDASVRKLVDELNHLREEHQWYYVLTDESPNRLTDHTRTLSAEQALKEVQVRERRMKAITEQLYLRSDTGHNSRVAAPTVGVIQSSLEPEVLLVEFYNDGQAVWAFLLDRGSLVLYQLSASVAQIDHLLFQLQFNLSCALKVAAQSSAARNLTGLAQRILNQLYTILLGPFLDRLASCKRLIIVPYGALHYLPFHLLYTGAEYLIECHEVVVLPAAGLITQKSSQRNAGALTLANSWDNRLPETVTEARMVQEILGGQVYLEQAADRSKLRTAPVQVLHIAAHGKHRIDQPDLSYIHLADGQIYIDDLLQNDLSYELVVLSGCETGRAKVSPGDELIGLGRGFLFAGAAALIASLWHVSDVMTLRLMGNLYQHLQLGSSKAAALRGAQRMIIADEPGLHPAFWGAFQLVGNADPLLGAEGAERGKQSDKYIGEPDSLFYAGSCSTGL